MNTQNYLYIIKQIKQNYNDEKYFVSFSILKTIIKIENIAHFISIFSSIDIIFES